MLFFRFPQVIAVVAIWIDHHTGSWIVGFSETDVEQIHIAGRFQPDALFPKRAVVLKR